MKTKIVLLDTGECPEDYRDNDGSISIEVCEKISNNIRESEISDLEDIISGFTNTFTQTVTKEDVQKLGVSNHAKIRNYRRYRGYLRCGAFKILDGYIIVNEICHDLDNCKFIYSFQIIGTHQLWKERMSEIKIHECITEQEKFRWNKENLIECFKNAPYKDGGKTFYPLLANLGEYAEETNIEGVEGKPPNRNNSVSLQDIQIIHYLKPILEQCFCDLGYELKSDFFNSDYFRRQAAFILDEQYASRSICEYSKLFKAKNTNTQEVIYTGDNFPQPEVIPLGNDSNNDCFDPDGVYNDGSLIFLNPFSFVNNSCGTVRYKFWYKLTFRRPLGPGGIPPQNPATVNLVALIGDGTQNTNFIEIPVADEDVLGGIIMEGCFEINVPSNCVVKLAWYSTLTDSFSYAVTSFVEGFWYNERISEFYLENDLVDINNSIDRNLTLEDIIIDLVCESHLKFNTDESCKTLQVEPDPNTYQLYNQTKCQYESIKGFQGNEIKNYVDWSKQLIGCGKINAVLEGQADRKNQRYCFKETTDSHPEYEQEIPLHSGTVDLGGAGKPEEKCLSLFEPTLNKRDDYLKVGDCPSPYIPHMWSSQPNGTDRPPRTNERTFRKLTVLGCVKQFETPTGPNAKWKFEKMELEEVPTVGQEFEGYYEIDGEIKQTPLNNVFGDQTNGTQNNLNTFYPELAYDTQGPELQFRFRLSKTQIREYEAGKILRLSNLKGKLSKYNGNYKICEIINCPNSKELTTVSAKSILNYDCINNTTLTPNQEETKEIEAQQIMLDSLLWVDACNINGNNTPTNNNTPIYNWADLSNSGNNLVQIGNESVPMFISSNKKQVEFTSDQMQTQNALLPSGGSSVMTVFAVMTTRTITDGYFVSINLIGPMNATGHWGWQAPNGTGQLEHEFAGSSTSYPWNELNKCTTYQLTTGRNLGIETSVLINKSETGTTSTGTNLNSGLNSLVVGRYFGGGQHQQFNLHELVIFNRILSTEEQTCIENYLCNKWQ